ncbi:cytochrome b/b6 domain-containing protein [Aureimonas jatrophae]|uniref:Thiosulfate reductase cytochrome b subunit n=1 Tax=Aureimonas jatrophae TaxID=1166073 RepID=A0A1H0MT45_9HYPH|nr:cytochrome b/b6 domain-containing protein [Aureimonas jatrophae]MBB3951237.1 thiosulfate reductase cytochrome b subunit [Aureimonas jatrophae]SDO83557.1 Thiosulfate reductase cytochrome b subunit [Aureimonas jatrophae]
MKLIAPRDGPVVRRQSVWTRATHWLWAIALFFLLLSGLQIFMARPDLYIGTQSGFAFDNSIFSIGAVVENGVLRGVTDLFGHRFDTTGWLGAVWQNGQLVPQSFPGWMVIPTYRDLASGRVVHFFFAWVLGATLLVWLISSLVNRHLVRDVLPRGRDLKALPRDVADHVRLRLHHGRSYNPLQKVSYFAVLFVALPLMILTGLTMSPGFNALAPWTLDLFGGRQTARTIHFVVMLSLVAFFVVHIAMVVLAGPFNELRSMITGRMRIDPEETQP